MTRSFLAATLTVFLSTVCFAGEIEDLLNKAKRDSMPVMLEMGSEGCVACEQMKPVLKRVSEEYTGRLIVNTVDISRNRDIARKFRVIAVPTHIILDKKGKEVDRHLGYFSYEDIKQALRKVGYK